MYETTESFRLSPLQRHLCALQQAEEPFPYHTHCAVRLEGRLDLSRLCRALERLVERYEILRTKFPRLPGLTWPVQVIDGDVHLPLIIHDYYSISSISCRDVPLWSGTEVSPSSGPDRHKALSLQPLSGPPQEYASMGMRQEDPLWQVTLITCSSDCHWLLWDLSALIADAQTCHILLRELSQLYMGLEVGEEELQETLQYADLAEWQYEWLESAEAAPGRDYWRFLEHVELVPTRLSTLSADMSPFITRSLAINLAPVTLTQLKALAQRLEVAPSAVLLACWGIVLSCLRGEVDLLIGVRSSGRNDEALTEAVGLLAKYLPLHGQFLASTSFSEIVRHLEATVHEAYKWQEYFSWQLFELYRQQGQEPFCPFNFDYETLPPPWSTGSDHEKLQWSVEKQEQCLDRFSVSLSCVENAQGMLVRLSYDQACFAQEEMQSLLTRWQTVLRQVLTSPDMPLGTLQLLTHEEQHWLLQECNATQTDYPQDKCLHQLFAEQVGHVSDTIALICGDEQVSYQELNKRANQLAHYLRRQGVGPEVRVGLCLERSVALLIGLLGILKADGVYVPLDPAYPQERLAFIQRDASISLLLTQEHLLGRLPDTYENILCLERDRGLIANENETAPEHRGTVEQLAYILYTSGSTGQPKGVMVPHRGLVNYLHWAARAYAAPESYGAPLHSPIGFDLTVTSVFVPLLTGQRIVLLPEEQGVAALATVLGSKSRFNLVKVTPSHLEVLSRYVFAAELAEEAQVMIIGGEALWYESLSLWRERAPQTKLVNEYGPTETVVGCCVYEVPEDAPASGVVPIGRPIANMQMYVLNDYLQPVLVGVSGELYIGGVGVTRGYLNRPELTAERFVPHPWSQEPGARLYRTGDLARYLPSGDLEYVGRVDQQVKIHGFRIEPGEIETQLRLYPGVQECIVVAREDKPGEKRLVAYVVAREASSSPSHSELRRFLLDKLPDYMVPTAFVLLPELPRTPNGKVDRRMLPLPDRTRPDLAEALVLARTPTEEILAGTWSTVLGREQVGIYDNFFALGGDSIRSIQALSLAQERGIHFSLQQLFRHQTIYDLVQVLGTEVQSKLVTEPVQSFSLISPQDRLRLPSDVEDAYPLTMLQAGMFFHSQYSPDSAVYHDIGSYHLQVPFNRELLHMVIQHLAACHPIMRTAFDLSAFSEPLQLVYRAVEIPLQVTDLNGFPPAEQDEMLAAWLEEDKSHPFDWTRAPLLRFQIHLRSEKTFQFTLTCHHAVLDGWSIAVLFTELFTAYLSFLRGDHASFKLSKPAMQFRDFVALERKLREVEEAKQYWIEKLRDCTSALLPRWTSPKGMGSRPTSYSDNASSVYALQVPISQEVSSRLKRLAQEIAVPLKSVLLAVHLRVMSVLHGQTDILTGLVSNARPETTDGERALGLFLNTLPLRLKLSGGTWIELIRETFAAECELLPHRWYPLAEIQKQQGGQTLFETLFNFIHFHVFQNVLNARKDADDFQLLGIDSFGKTNFTLGAIFFLDPLSSQIHLTLRGNTSGTGPETTGLGIEQVEAIGRYYATALGSLVSEPRGRYELQSLLSAREQLQLLVEWNATQTDHQGRRRWCPQDLCLHQLFEQQVERASDAVALVLADEVLTYGELNCRANQLAHYLQGLGVGPEVLVGICMERCVEMVIGLLAVLKAGGAYVPLDPTSPSSRLAFLLQDAQVSLLLALGDEGDEQLASSSVTVVYINQIWAGLVLESSDLPHSGVDSRDTAYVLYTSGSTGTPKGVVVEHQQVVNYVMGIVERADLRESACYAILQPLTVDSSVTMLFGALLQGGILHLISQECALEPLKLANLFACYPADYLKMAPSHLMALVTEVEAGQLLPQRCLILGGEASAWQWMESLLAFLPAEPVGQPCRLYNHYGPTETTVGSLTYQVKAGAKGEARGLTPIGQPLANTQVYIRDPLRQIVPIGVEGELWIGGEGLARGYIGRADLTAERFVPNPYGEPGSRLYRTGDRARFLDDGAIEFLGRGDRQVKIRGWRIEPTEIEEVLRQHEEIQACVVACKPDPYEVRKDGYGKEPRLVAYVVLHPKRTLTVMDLHAYLRKCLPAYMIPSAYVFLDALPLTPHGKLDHRALPQPVEVQDVEMREEEGARTPIEELLVGLWEEVLGLRQVKIHDNFFERGGHSLLATRLIARVRALLGGEVPLRAVFEAPTVAGFAQWVEQALRKGEEMHMPPLVAVDRPEQIPLSFAQQRLWFLDQLEPESTTYLSPRALRLQGHLQAQALSQSMQELVRRHESLRTTFEVRTEQTVQVIHEVTSAGGRQWPPIIDLQGLSPKPREEEVHWLAQQEAQRPCNLATGPLLRTYLLRLSTQEHVLLLTQHHIITDEWSNSVLMHELSTLYQANVLGQPCPLSPLPIQYADYALWQRDWLQGQVLDAQMAYWRKQLADVSPLALPTDHPRPAFQTHQGAMQMRLLPQDVSSGLRALSQKAQVTLFMLLLAAFQVLLARYSHQNDIAVGTPITNRTRAELEGLIGFFVNTLVMRTDLSGDPTFVEVLSRVREVCLEAYTHQDIPFEKVVEVLAQGTETPLERDLSRSPLFQVMFVLQDTMSQEHKRLAEVSVEPLDTPTASTSDVATGASKFDLTLFAFETRQGLRIAISYSTTLFEAESIIRMLSNFQTLLAGVVQNPQAHISDLPLLSPAQRHQQLVEWNTTQRDYPQNLCVHQFFEQQVEQTPDAIALVFQDEHLTYADLNQRANHLSHSLQHLGVGPEIVVGICMERSPEMVVGLLAIFKAGGAYVPLDSKLPTERLVRMMTSAQPVIVLTQTSLMRAWPVDHCQFIYLDADWEYQTQVPPLHTASQVTPENLAYIIYTSGSTGVPKGAMLTQRGMLNHLLAKVETLQLSSTDRIAQTASLSFDISVWQFLAALLVGGQVFLLPDEIAQNPGAIFRQVSLLGITVLELVPSMLQVALEEPIKPVDRAFISQHLHWMLVTGEACSTALLQDFWQCYQEIPVVNAYGPTECSDDVTHAMLQPGRAMPSWSAPLGSPIANTQIYVLDERLQPLPMGVPGELYVGGIGVGRGYLSDPARTALAFVPNPFAPLQAPEHVGGGRLYRTGDLVRYRADGTLEYLGRIDQQIKLRGFRIELGEIEANLRACPGVQEAVVVLREEGEARKYLAPATASLVAYIVQSEGFPTGMAALQEYLHERLPDYMVPTHFVFLDRLPITANGKIDRRALPAPANLLSEQYVRFVGPRTPLEELLAQIWAQVLGCSQVGIYENFFQLGGHSLLATQVVSRIRQAVQVEVPLRTLFEAPTIAQFSLHLGNLIRGAPSAYVSPIEQTHRVEPMERPRDLPLSFAQQRLWFLDQLEPGSTAYLLSRALHFQGHLQVQAVEQSLQALVHRHEILRTTFVGAGQANLGYPVQVVHPAGRYLLPIIDLQGLRQGHGEEEACRLAREEAQYPCDLEQGPLLRTYLLRLERQVHILLLTQHHIITDGWSSQVLVHELSTLYQACVVGQPALLAPLPIQYADYALWQRQWLQGSDLEEQMAYWRRQLTDLAPLELPTDHLRSAVRTGRGASQSWLLPKAVLDELLDLCRKQDVTLFMLLLAAFQVLLMRYTGQTDISVGTPIANRTRAEFEGLIGFFVNTLVLRTDVGGNPTFEQLLHRVREVCLGAYVHQDIPFEKVVEVLAPERDISHTPLFQVMLALQNIPGEAGRGLVPMARDLGEVSVTLWPSGGSTTSKIDLTFLVSQTEQGLNGVLEYSTDLFEAESITRLLGNFQTLLQGIVDNPQARVADLPLLTQEECRQLLVEWNVPLGMNVSASERVGYAGEASSPTDKPSPFSPTSPPSSCVHELFEQQVGRTPDAVALVLADEVLTYGELNCRANQLAHYLQRLGVGPEVLVGISLQRSLEMIIGLLAVFKAGGAYVPLDADYPAARLALMMQETRIAVLLTRKRLERRWSAACACVVVLEQVWEQLLCESEQNLESRVGLENLAYILYTSGSTGLPKGVQVSHRGLCNVMLAHTDMFGLGVGSRVLQYAALNFDVSVLETFVALLAGGSLHLTLGRPLGADLWQMLEQQALTWIAISPSVLAGLPEREPLPALQTLVVGGEVCPVGVMRRWSKRRRFVNEYGCTEATVCTSLVEYGMDMLVGEGSDLVPLATNLEGSLLCLGRPLVNTQMYLLDGNLQPVPVGVIGEICLGGVGLARGYLGRADLTAERFVPHPFVGTVSDCDAGARLYRTGDLARYRGDGSIEFLGRRDLQVQVRSIRIELGEIEATLQAHPEVREAVVVLREEGEARKYLVAYVTPLVPQTEESPTTRGGELALTLQRYLREQLPDAMVPTHVVVMETLPLTPNGKVDRVAIGLAPMAPVGGERKDSQGVRQMALYTPLQELLACIWEDVLHLQEVGIHESFFELGGHSLLATQVVSRIRQAVQVEMPLRTLFESPTVVQLSLRLEDLMRGAPGRGEPWLPLQPMKRPSNLPLSFAQERLWFLDQWNKGSTWYSVPMALRLSGSLQVAALESSLATVVQRHEALRTSFEDRSGSPVQVIAQTLPIQIPVIDLSNWGGDTCDLQVSQLARAEAERGFDLVHGPLLRVCLLRLDEQEHVLLFTLHHIVSDGWSMEVLVREITALYQAQIAGRSIELPELPIQYADYALWQRQWLQGSDQEEQLAYWRRQLADLAPLELPTDHQRPAVGTDRGASQSCLLPAALSRKLLGLCRKQDVTLFMLLLAAFQVLLMRYTGQTDISVGSPIANRTKAEFEGLIGFFVNTLVLRTDLGGSPTFEQLLRRVREVCLGAYMHQDIPFEKVVEVLIPERDISRTPLFQVMLVLQNTSGETGRDMAQTVRDLGGVSVTPLWPSEGSTTSKFDLRLLVSQKEQGLACVLEYSTDLFEAKSITRLLGNFQTLLQGIVDDPQTRVADLPLLTEEERCQLLVEWNVPIELASPPSSCVHELFEQQVGRTPDAVALVLADEVLTYGELNCRANQLAHYLQELGVGPEVLVGISLQRSLEMIIGLLAVFKAGGAYVPLDADYPAARLALMMQETRIAVLLTRKRLERQWSAACACVVVLEQVWEQLLCESEQNLVSRVGLENLAYILYTSGSTGLPKGVQVSHRGLGNVALAHTDMFGLGAGSRVLQYAALNFDVSILEIFRALLAGGSLHLSLAIPPGPDLLQVLDEQAITCMMVVSSVLTALPETKHLPALQTLFVGGEVYPVEVMRRWAKGRRFFSEYGSTEATICTSLVEYNMDMPVGEGGNLVPLVTNLEWSSLSLGRPFVNTQMYLLDGNLQPVPVGVIGEICLGGVGVARGYLGRADLTAERFIPHPFVGTVPDCDAGARLYRTGDLARYRGDGSIEFLGRRDLQVKVRGYRIELGEIEAQLQRHPAIQDCVVLAREDVPGEKRLVAYLVLQEGVPMGTVHSLLGDIRGYLQDHLPAYMIPLVFIPLDALPLKPNGKLDRQVLSTLEESNRLSLVNDAQANQSIQPRDAIELQLVQIWEEVLQIQPVSVLADFFAIGGHSLLAVRLMSRIAQHFGHRLNLATIFQHSTVAELAVILRQQVTSDERSPVVALQSQGSRPPFFCVHPAGGTAFCYVNLARYLGPDQPFYGLHAPDRSRCEGVAGHGTLSTDCTTVEEMAAAYVAAIQEVQPQGPYLLGGWSLGGIIAFEMACQLQRQGEEVGLLAVIDSRFPNEQMRAQAGQKEIDLGDGSMARELINLVGVTVPDDFDQREPHEQFSYAVEQTKKMHVFPVDTSPEFVRHFVRTSLLNQHMMSVYVPQRYQHRIDYFVASASLEKMNSLGAREDPVGSREASPVLQQQDQLQHWRELTSNIEVHLVPGNHQDMILQDANVRELAHALRGCIDRVSVDAKV